MYLPNIFLLLSGSQSDQKIVKEVMFRLISVAGTHQARLSPSELLVTIHDAEPQTGARRAVEATNICFENKEVFNTEVLAIVLQKLIEKSPLPPLMMRTILKSVQLHSSLAPFVVNLMKRLLAKKVWEDDKLWKGFVLCLKETKAVNLIPQLPKAQTQELFRQQPALKTLYKEYLGRKEDK